MSDSTEAAPKTSRTAKVASWLGIAAPVLSVGGVLLSQLGLPAMVGFRLFTLAILLGLLALLVGLVGLITTRGGVGGRGQALLGIGMGVVMLAVVVLGAGSGGSAPAINDITTNLADPPQFTGQPDRDMSFPPPLFEGSYSDDEYRALIRTAYPDLEPIRISESPDAAYQAALARARDMGWNIVVEDPAAGRIEAEDRTALFRFVDDVAIRVRADADGEGAVIDVRSKSRDGRGDIGANAARIRAFRDGL
jgi:uncharacterized protein (DUF1499 family)